LLISGSAWAAREAAPPAACYRAAQTDEIAGAKAAVAANPADLRARLKLADAWSDVGCFSDAVQVLQAGEDAHPRDKELQARLQVAKSVLSEQSYFDSMDQSAKDARYSRAAFRCTKLSDLSACDDGLSMRPTDPDLMVSKGDALLQQRRVGEAIGSYRNALSGASNRDAVIAKISNAESQRHALLETCETHVGETALRACESVLLRGAPDEALVLRRTGLLLQSDNQLARALDVYMAAQRLRPDDHSVAQAIVSLSDSTGRKDALTLTARGTAFMTLDKPAEAMETLREAVRMAPDLLEAKNQLRTAERANGARSDRPAPAADKLASSPGRPAARRFSNDAPVSMSN